MKTRPGIGARRRWWGLVASPLLLSTVASFVLLFAALVAVAQALANAECVRRRAAQACARLAADMVAMQQLSGPAAEPARIQVAGMQVTVAWQGTDWRVETRGADGDEFAFLCARLAGAAPEVLGSRAAVVESDVLDRVLGARHIHRCELPRVDEHALASAVPADVTPTVRRDQGVALLQWAAGTDGDDYVINRRPKCGFNVTGDLLVVPGHLWVEPGECQLEIELTRDLVIVVRGNLYVGRSIAVRGPGRLLFATVPGPQARAFADRDGNGRWSGGDVLRGEGEFTGPIEGGGNVYLGLNWSRSTLDLGAALVVGGELHLMTDARVSGPLIVPHGITATTPGARVVAAGDWAFDPDRERVPGFQTRGGPRPGRLREVGTIPAPLPEQPLYLPQPAR
ncbi:MAG TPA: hypothetical protein VF384_16475 [Planctomycetota bacterium]